MKQLDLEIKTNARTYSKIKRDSFKAIYKSNEGYFEVFRVDVAPPIELFGVEYPEREIYPNSEAFGATAWCTRYEERANEIYDKIEPKRIKK